MHRLTPPENEHILLLRCQALSGLTFHDLALQHHQTLPSSLTRAKGFMGQLLEAALGTSAGNQSEPDFPNLGIELKTIPIDSQGKVRESTYVCTAPTHLNAVLTPFEKSPVFKKLSHVLFIPIEADPTIPLPERRIGQAYLWQPDLETKAILKNDWEELSSMLHLGQTARLSAKSGMYLQIRPKAANSRIVQPHINEDGERIWLNPKGFYLRTVLTQKILDAHYCRGQI